MKKGQIFTLISLLILLIFAGACEAESPTQPTPKPTIDTPQLSAVEAISIAQEHSITSPLNIYERQASLYAR